MSAAAGRPAASAAWSCRRRTARRSPPIHAGGSTKADIFENPGVLLAVAEADIAELDLDGDCEAGLVDKRDLRSRPVQARCRPGARREASIVRSTILLISSVEPAEELVLVGDEGDQQADRHRPVEHAGGAEPDDEDREQPEQQRVCGAETAGAACRRSAGG